MEMETEMEMEMEMEMEISPTTATNAPSTTRPPDAIDEMVCSTTDAVTSLELTADADGDLVFEGAVLPDVTEAVPRGGQAERDRTQPAEAHPLHPSARGEGTGHAGQIAAAAVADTAAGTAELGRAAGGGGGAADEAPLDGQSGLFGTGHDENGTEAIYAGDDTGTDVVAPGAPAPVAIGGKMSATAGAAGAAHTGPDLGGANDSAKGTGRVPAAEEPSAANPSANPGDNPGDLQKEREMRERMLANRGDLQKEKEMRERMLKRKESLSSPQEPTKQPRLETTPPPPPPAAAKVPPPLPAATIKALRELKWDHPVNLCGVVVDATISRDIVHYCKRCTRPILRYGRLLTHP